MPLGQLIFDNPIVYTEPRVAGTPPGRRNAKVCRARSVGSRGGIRAIIPAEQLTPVVALEEHPIMSTGAKKRLSPEDYLEFERKSETKHEFFDGEIFAMAGGDIRPFRSRDQHRWRTS